MNLIDKYIETYCADHTDEEPPALSRIARDTYAHVLSPRMLSGNFQGRFLSLLAHLCKPEYILEIGTYTGYSAICMAEALIPGGKLITIEANAELESRIKQNVILAQMQDKIEIKIGQASAIIPDLPFQFDLVFIDADKLSYDLYYDQVFDKVKPNGLIICDNVLWDGKVIEPKAQDKTTRYLREFNSKLKEDYRTQKVLLPVRDGLFISRKLE